MIYVVDNMIFSKALLNLDLSVFDDIYDPWVKLIEEGRIVSCDEVFHELERKFDKSERNMTWLKSNKKCFQQLSNSEASVLREIYNYAKFREGVKEKNIREGNPESDAMLVAKAKIKNGVVVTDERNHAPNSDKIPNIAVEFGVRYMPSSEFFRMLRNIHSGRDELTRVAIYDSLILSDRP